MHLKLCHSRRNHVSPVEVVHLHLQYAAVGEEIQCPGCTFVKRYVGMSRLFYPRKARKSATHPVSYGLLSGDPAPGHRKTAD
jgi:hypothetical protein